VRDAFAVQVEQEDLVAELRAWNRREDARPVLGHHRFAGVHRPLHRRVAKIGDDQGQGRGTVLHDRAGEIVELEGGVVIDRAADQDDVPVVDLAVDAEVMLAIGKAIANDAARLCPGETRELVHELLIIFEREQRRPIDPFHSATYFVPSQHHSPLASLKKGD
jgi:hypothetical protein